MELTSKLYELREAIEKSDVYLDYQKATREALEDVRLQMLFGEIDKYTELSERFSQTIDNVKYQKKLQQLKVEIFANQNYENYRQAEKKINGFRQSIAQRLFGEIDEEIFIEGTLKKRGAKQCG